MLAGSCLYSAPCWIKRVGFGGLKLRPRPCHGSGPARRQGFLPGLQEQASPARFPGGYQISLKRAELSQRGSGSSDTEERSLPQSLCTAMITRRRFLFTKL